MHAFWFFLLLVFQGFAFTWVYPLLIAPLMGFLMLATRKNSEKVTPVVWFAIVIGFVGTAYVLWGWAAYIASLSHSFSSAPEVTHHWLYFVIGFFGCSAPLSSMAAGEDNIGSTIHIFLTSIAFIVFCIWPSAASALYGWVPALFGR
jgi:hypothetical protein